MGLHLMSKAEKRDHIVAPPDCTGCSLCANVCGHDAIAMVWSEEGFLIPQVDEGACVGCGLCVLKCPALQERPKVQDELRDSVPTFGAWHRDAEVHRASSSGGVFTALASWVLAQGGCVFGVVWLWPIANWTDFLLAAGVYGSVCALVLFFFYLRREEREMFIGPLRRFLPGR